MNGSLLDDLIRVANTLEDGDGRSGLTCPNCEGGTSNEHSLHLRRRGYEAFFKCYRATCPKPRGVVQLLPGKARANAVAKPLKSLDYFPKAIDEGTTEYLVDRYNLSDDELSKADFGLTHYHCKMAETRLYIPILRRDRSLRGYVARDISGTEKQKALTFLKNEEEPHLGWYDNPTSKRLIILEDLFSALRASTYINAVGLLGAELTRTKVEEIRREGFTEAYLALDADATRKAVRTSIDWRNLIKLRIVALDKDIKDMSREELTTFMENL